MPSILEFFTDPVLRDPTIGCMLICLAASLVGVLAMLRKQSLIGEALSHAAYPGVMLGVVASGALGFFGDISYFVIIGAFVSACFGIWVIHFLEARCRIPGDAALCLVLSLFFGLGVTLASRVQFTHSSLYQQSLVYLYGQAATMTDRHIVIYAVLSLLIVFMVIAMYKELQVICFDRSYASSLGIPVLFIEVCFFAITAIAVVVGIRSVGVVLMSAMLIAPAAAARQYTQHLSRLLMLSSMFGLLSGYFGIYFSVVVSHYSSSRLVLPTGPMIVLVASSICLFSLLFAPERGMVSRRLRIWQFRYRCLGENILKSIWRSEEGMTASDLAHYQTISKSYRFYILWRLCHNRWLIREKEGRYVLTKAGQTRASRIVRLHRLWEVYLTKNLGVGAERVHHNAEEMEHIITPELEEELSIILDDPKMDPHHQPIPPKEGKLL